jgi:hypothetical protein
MDGVRVREDKEYLVACSSEPKSHGEYGPPDEDRSIPRREEDVGCAMKTRCGKWMDTVGRARVEIDRRTNDDVDEDEG